MEPIIFSTYLKKKEDEKNRIFLVNDKLVVVFNNKVQAFYRSNILKMSIAKKKLIIPLVIGGIGTSLSMIATSMGWYDRQLNLLVTLLFFGVLYYGFVGKDALEIFEKGNTNVYLLGGGLEPIQKFISFFSSTKSIQMLNTEEKIYHIAEKSSWENQQYESRYKHDSLKLEGFIHSSKKENLIETYKKYYGAGEELVLLVILPKLIENRIEREWVESRNAYFPHIFGEINKSSILSVSYFHSEGELANLIST